MNVILLDTPKARESLQPFSYVMSLAKLRVGIRTIEEKWQHYLPGDYSYLTAPYLHGKFPCVEAQENLCIDSTFCPNPILVAAIKRLKKNQRLVVDTTTIAAICDKTILQTLQDDDFDTSALRTVFFEGPYTQIKQNWDIFLHNEQELRNDFRWVTQGREVPTNQDQHTILYNKKDIFLAEGVSTKAAILNAEKGPIYIGRNTTIQEGAIIKGPVAICESVQINPGAIISRATTIGPHSKVGGEVQNSVILGYSNKAHDGFMGNSVVGMWCNIGAGTHTSNLRNDYAQIKMWDNRRETFKRLGIQFCGIFMGDYSRCGIGTMFDAGTVVGISTHLLGIGLFDKVIPSFTWGIPSKHIQTYRLPEALAAAARMMERRSATLTEEDKKILTHIFLTTAIYRS